MKLLKKVKPIEVKRAFIISDFVRRQDYRTDYMKPVTPAVYKKQVAKAKKIILQLPEGILDLILAGEWKQRAHAYSKSDWYIAEVSTDEVGVWRAAGHLPLKWTKGSLS